MDKEAIKTKSKFLEEAYDKHLGPQKYHKSNLFNTYENVCLSAMTEFAKQEAIGFGQYLGEWGWELCPAGHSEVGKWVSPINLQCGFKTTEELYSLYKSQVK